MISGALEGDLQQIGDGGMLVWLPAHQSMASIGEAKLSDGTRLSHLDWRANRLVDAFAKAAAAINQPPPAVVKLLESAKVAVRHSATLLGRVTHAANHHSMLVVGPDGLPVTKVCRDSVDRPRVARDAPPPKPVCPQPKRKAVLAPRQVKPWQPQQRATIGCRRQPSRVVAARNAEAYQVQRRVEEVGQSLQVPSDRPLGSDRLLALRRRVLGRLEQGEDHSAP